MIERISESCPPIRFQLNRLKRDLGDERQAFHETIDRHLADYCRFHDLDTDSVCERYLEFVGRYASDLKHFERTGQFPYQREHSSDYSPDRQTYDLFLIISALVTPHRFALMEGVATCRSGGRALIMGAGPGLELLLLESRFSKLDAADLSVSPFLRERFPNVRFFNEFPPDKEVYDTVFAIELIEHLSDPYGFLAELRDRMTVCGCAAITTVNNVPQFDHVNNFSDPLDFERNVCSLGLRLDRKWHVPHEYLFSNVDANNTFYLLTRSPGERPPD